MMTDRTGGQTGALANDRVSFLIAGAQKCGTTALDGYLRQHPGVEMARTKEVHFFDREHQTEWRNPDYGPLHEQYSDRLAIIRGEATPINLYWTPSHPRIFAYNPNMKFILLFRDPVDRAYSHWRMTRSKGLEPLIFSDAIRAGRVRVLDDPEQNGLNRIHSYVERGFYGRQLSLLKSWFPLSNMLFIRQSDLLSRPSSVLESVCRFLSVDWRFEFSQRILNVSEHNEEHVSIEDREYLNSLYKNDRRLFESITGLSI